MYIYKYVEMCYHFLLIVNILNNIVKIANIIFIEHIFCPKHC